MFFRQLKFFELSKTPENTEQLMEQLNSFIFQPCPPSFAITQGWTPPVGDENAPLAHSIPHFAMICMQFEEKLLPVTVVRQAVKDKIKEIEITEGRRVKAKEKQQLTEEMRYTLLPQAFSKFSQIHAMIDIKQKLLIVNCTQEKKLETFLAIFKRTFKDVELNAPKIKKLMPVMTNWLINNKHPDNIAIEKSAVFQDPSQERRTIRCQQQDLHTASIQLLFKEGLAVKQLGLSWNDQINFILHDDFSLRSVRFQDELLEAAKEINAETEEQAFDANFAIMSESFHLLYQDLIKQFADKTAANADAELIAEPA